MGPTEDKILMLPLLAQYCAAVLLTTVHIWDGRSTCGDRRWGYAIKTANSK